MNSGTHECGHGATHGHEDRHAPADGDAVTTKGKDPVCGMTVDPATARHRFEHQGQTYVFCCAGCLGKFVADPQRYLAPPEAGARTAPQAARDAIYTCPMHPEIEQVGPGDCPICGMALEPKTARSTRGRAPSSWTCAGASWSARSWSCRS